MRRNMYIVTANVALREKLVWQGERMVLGNF